jgi:RNA-binding protein
MSLTDSQRKYLRRLGHELKPVVLTGAGGYSQALVAELAAALDRHELLKIRVRAADREQRDAILGRLCEATHAELVQRIGHTALLWRPNPERRRVSLPPD